MIIKLSKTKKAALSLSILASSLLSGLAHASNRGYNIDGLLGIDLVSGGATGSSSTSSLGFGARLGYHLNPNWELGVGFTTTSNSVNVGTNVNSSTTNLLLADLNYHLPNEWDPLYFGIRMGIGLNSGSSSTSTNNYSSTNFAYGVVGGYDVKVNESFTIGPRVAYTLVSQNPGNLGDFQAHAAFKYFF